jgi:hypothetical protein
MTDKTLRHGLRLLELGYWVVAIKAPGEPIRRRNPLHDRDPAQPEFLEKPAEGKEPVGKGWGLVRWTPQRLRAELLRREGRGIGAPLGPGRAPGGDWLIALDEDGPQARESLAKFLGGEIPDTPGWDSTRGGQTLWTADGPRLLAALSGAGATEGTGIQAGVYHLDDLLPDLELRVGGFHADGTTVKQIQSVLPPTPGTDGRPRAWRVTPRTAPAPLPEAAYALLEQRAAERRAAAAAPAPTPRARARDFDPHDHPAVLRRACDDLARAVHPHRHATLLHWSLPLASRVKGGVLSEREVLDGLHAAAQSNGMLAMGRQHEIADAWRTALEKADTWVDRPLRDGQAAGARSAPDRDAELDRIVARMPDEALVARIRESKQGARFAALFARGELDRYQGDVQAAALGLLAILAHWTRRDPARMARLFDQSALARTDAWREQSGDRDRAIAAAIDGCAKVYSPVVDRKDRTGARPAAADTPYSVEAGRLCRMVATRDGISYAAIPLCNFDAHIDEEVIRDDGVEQFRRFTISGKLDTGASLPAIQITADEFPRGDWPLTRWGTRAIVFAGQGNKDHLRTAVQILSDQAASRVVYAHTGWRRIDGQMAYLHAAGAIGPLGPLPCTVELPAALERFALPDPPVGAERTEAVRAMPGMLSVAPDRVTMPLFAMIVRSVLPGCAFSGHLVGRTGTGKTELAALCQQCFGPEMTARCIPANWSSTSNSLEALAFCCQDALLVVDDFAPHGAPTDIARFHKEADRLFRAQGNRSGRQRMRADGSLRPEKPPRGTILATGEDLPRGHSVRARLMIIEVEPGDVDFARLSRCQHDAASGLYAKGNAAFIAWLAPQFDAVVQQFRKDSVSLRDKLASSASHRRVPAMIGELLAAFDLFLKFSVEAGALSEDQSADLRARCRTALQDSAERQEAHQAAADPVERYFSLVQSTLSSGRAHVATTDGKAPAEPHQPTAWGWQRDEDGGWRERGRLIGWIEGTDLLLDPESAFAEANRLAGDQGEAFGLSIHTLYKRLAEKGLLAGTDRKRHTERRMIGGVRRRVLHLRASILSESGPSGPSGPDRENPAENGPLFGTAFSEGAEKRSTKAVQIPAENGASGPLGPLGPLPRTEESPQCADPVDWQDLDPNPY